MKKALIGISAWHEQKDGRGRFVLGDAYCSRIEEAGGVPLILPFAAANAPALVSCLDGLMLSGGEDLDPVLFGEERLPACGTVSAERDASELALLAAAEALRLPVLGICRGVQVMNVFRGGTLWQDLSSQCALPKELHSPGNYTDTHPCVIEGESRLASILGAGSYPVNSSHHQAVKTTALRVAARDETGVIEAVEGADERFFVGVQWHPERMTDSRLFEAFVSTCEAGR